MAAYEGLVGRSEIYCVAQLTLWSRTQEGILLSTGHDIRSTGMWWKSWTPSRLTLLHEVGRSKYATGRLFKGHDDMSNE